MHMGACNFGPHAYPGYIIETAIIDSMKCGAWALTLEWALAQDTMVLPYSGKFFYGANFVCFTSLECLCKNENLNVSKVY